MKSTRIFSFVILLGLAHQGPAYSAYRTKNHATDTIPFIIVSLGCVLVGMNWYYDYHHPDMQHLRTVCATTQEEFGDILQDISQKNNDDLLFNILEKYKETPLCYIVCVRDLQATIQSLARAEIEVHQSCPGFVEKYFVEHSSYLRSQLTALRDNIMTRSEYKIHRDCLHDRSYNHACSPNINIMINDSSSSSNRSEHEKDRLFKELINTLSTKFNHPNINFAFDPGSQVSTEFQTWYNEIQGLIELLQQTSGSIQPTNHKR